MISVILPTVRPHLVNRALASIKANDVPVELIVVADFDQPQEVMVPHVRWIVRQRAGTVDANNAGYATSRGDYVFLMNDESVLGDDCLDSLWKARRVDAVLTPRHEPAFNFSYYGRRFAPFPFVHRRLVDSFNYPHHPRCIFDPMYRSFYADPDFSLQALTFGCPINVVEGAIIHHHQEHDAAHNRNVHDHLAADRAAFRARWDHLGTFADPT